MSLPKREGGLGFRDIEKFNEALLAKQAWRILQDPHCLLARLLKSRYFPDTSLREAKIPKKTSHGWRSIMCGRDLLFRGIRYQIGNGRTINPLTDPWIPSHPPRSVSHPSLPLPPRLNDLWQSNGKQWDDDKLQRFLPVEDRNSARRLYIPSHPCEDKLIWHYTKSGSYTVKSGYWLSTHYPDPTITPPTPPPGDPTLKQRIWKTNLSPKIKHFLWRILSRAIGSGVELTRRGIPIDASCKRCCNDLETTDHIFFQCDYAIAVWRTSNLPASVLPSASRSLAENIEGLLQVYNSSDSTESQHYGFWLLWQIWKSMNDLIFNKIHHDPSVVHSRAKDNTLQWASANSHSLRTTSQIPSQMDHSLWSPPPPELYKCNVDASFIHNANFIGARWILRDHKGQFMLAGSSQLKQGSNSLEAEGIALLHGLQSIWCRGFRSVIMEGDCKELYDLLHQRSYNASLNPIIVDIRSWADKFTHISFTLVPRHGNQVADSLAKLLHRQSDTAQIHLYPPRFLRRFLFQDSVNTS